MVWPRCNTWQVFGGMSVTLLFNQLKLMLSERQQHLAFMADKRGSGAVANDEPQPASPRTDLLFTSCSEQDICSLISFVWAKFQAQAVRCSLPGFESFGTLAAAFGLPAIAQHYTLIKQNVSYKGTVCAPVCDCNVPRLSCLFALACSLIQCDWLLSTVVIHIQ